MTFSVLIAGSGGQGVLSAGKVLATAALIEGLDVTWFPSYGAAMRGGAANCTVIISDMPIGYPVSEKIDAFIALNGTSLECFEGRVEQGGLLLLDSSNIKTSPARDDLRVIAVPVSKLAGGDEPRSLPNVFLIGALAGKIGLLSHSSFIEAINKASLRDIDQNLRAFEAGKEFSSIDKES